MEHGDDMVITYVAHPTSVSKTGQTSFLDFHSLLAMTPDPTVSEQIDFQIETLRNSLADSETAWRASGFSSIRNPVAESIRGDIQCRERLQSEAA
jgi:hypothetical protein